MKDLDLNLRTFGPEQWKVWYIYKWQYILENDYVFEHDGKNLLIKFIKFNFSYNLSSSDEIKIEGDIQVGWVQNQNQM